MPLGHETKDAQRTNMNYMTCMNQCIFCWILLSFLIPQLSSEETPTRGFVLKRQQDKSCVALVVGNAAYPDQPLANPANDATDVAAALEGIGFTVTRLINADRATFQKAVDSFGAQIKGKQASAFYYAGHGMQVNGENYLIPVGEQIDSETDVPFKAVNAGLILAKMEAAQCPLNLVILDACRNNPFARSGRGVAKGLTELRGPAGSLIVYSTAPGQVASDGVGRNGAFTSALLRHISTPGQNIDMCLRVVSGDVQKTTGGTQIPWRSSSLTQDFCFVPQLSPEDLEFERRQRGAVLTEIEKQQAGKDQQRKNAEDQSQVIQAEIDALEAQIRVAQQKLGIQRDAKVNAVDDLDGMLALVESRDAVAAELKLLLAKADQLKKQRESELQYAQRTGGLKASIELSRDLAKYRNSTSSTPGRNMAKQLWDALLLKWEAKLVPVGDEAALAKALNIVAFPFPSWAQELGTDEYGAWATLRVGSQMQTMRFVIPGSIRIEPKGARPYTATVYFPFWLGNADVTTAMWKEIMGTDPRMARITGMKAPVIVADQRELSRFFDIIKQDNRTYTFNEPAESQWNYACHVGNIKALHNGADISVTDAYDRWPKGLRICITDMQGSADNSPKDDAKLPTEKGNGVRDPEDARDQTSNRRQDPIAIASQDIAKEVSKKISMSRNFLRNRMFSQAIASLSDLPKDAKLMDITVKYIGTELFPALQEHYTTMLDVDRLNLKNAMTDSNLFTQDHMKSIGKPSP